MIDSIGSKWLKEIIATKQNPYKLIHQKYKKNKSLLKKELMNTINLINNLPQEKMLLPIYASIYTQDPHYLDLDNPNGTLYFYCLSFIENIDFPNSRKDKIKLLSKFHIEIDNLSNYVLTFNLLSNKDYLNQFSKNKESLILNIQNIVTTKSFDTKTKQVFIFENPSILNEIISQNIDCSVIISGGFPNTSVYLLLDKLLETGNSLYYNGDFDPEGLLIADKLKEKYQEKINLFCYEEVDYQNCISNKKLSDKRLKKLVKVTAVDLQQIKKILQKEKYAAYQENNKNNILNSIVMLLSNKERKKNEKNKKV